MSRGHLNWGLYMKTEAKKAGLDIGVAFLEYGLIPEYKYPTQLFQGNVAVQHLLEVGFAPSDIVLLGDSAGGNLVLSILSHALHPYPSSIPSGLNAGKKAPALRLSSPLRAAVLVSPWLTGSTSTQSFISNEGYDVLSTSGVRDCAELLYDGTSIAEEVKNGQAWGSTYEAPDGWWTGLGEKAVQRVLVTAGTDEIFRDHICTWSDKMKSLQLKGVQWESRLAEKEAHDEPLMGFTVRRPASETSKVLTKFIIDSFLQTEEKAML
jgi:acetyl esterase/lipase